MKDESLLGQYRTTKRGRGIYGWMLLCSHAWTEMLTLFRTTGLRASPRRWPRQVRPARHPRPCLRWWSHFSDLVRCPPTALFSILDISPRRTGCDSDRGLVLVLHGGANICHSAVRQAISKALIAYNQKFVDEHTKNLLKQALTQFDRTLLVADNRRCEPKKFGGPGARARFQKSYR